MLIRWNRNLPNALHWSQNGCQSTGHILFSLVFCRINRTNRANWANRILCNNKVRRRLQEMETSWLHCTALHWLSVNKSNSFNLVFWFVLLCRGRRSDERHLKQIWAGFSFYFFLNWQQSTGSCVTTRLGDEMRWNGNLPIALHWGCTGCQLQWKLEMKWKWKWNGNLLNALAGCTVNRSNSFQLVFWFVLLCRGRQVMKGAWSKFGQILVFKFAWIIHEELFWFSLREEVHALIVGWWQLSIQSIQGFQSISPKSDLSMCNATSYFLLSTLPHSVSDCQSPVL